MQTGNEKKTDERNGADAKAEESDTTKSTEAAPDTVEEETATKEKVNLDTKDEDRAAIKIQSAYRGSRARKKVTKMIIDEGRKCERGKEGAKKNHEEKKDRELQLRASREERARRMKEKFEEIDDEELKYKQEMRRKLKEEKSLSIF